MKPHVSMLMISSLDGSLHPSRFTSSPNGTRKEWSSEYEQVHGRLKADAWLVGRVTMAEISKVVPHVPSKPHQVERHMHIVPNGAKTFAIAMDWSGKLHFEGSTLGGDHVIVLLGENVSDDHLAELTADGVSYIISLGVRFDLPALLDILAAKFGIKHLLVEGGAGTNGAFLAAGVVDEFRLLVAPALEGAAQVQTIVAHDKGLAGLVQLKFKSATPLAHGVVELLYAVSSAST